MGLGLDQAQAPGSAVRHISAVGHVTICATQIKSHLSYYVEDNQVTHGSYM